MVRRKKKKKSSKKIPPNRGTDGKAYNDFVVVLENVYSEIDALRESQDLMREKMEQGFSELGEAIQNLDHRVTALEVKINQLAEDMAHVKQEIRLIRHDLSQKVNREEFEILTERVDRLEKELGVR